MVAKSLIVSFALCIVIGMGYIIPVTCYASGINVIVPSSGIKTINDAMVRARPGDTIVVEDGTYPEHLFIKAGVTLRAKNIHKAIINGKGRGTAVTMATNTTIIGFIVKNATIGIFSKNASVAVLKCKVIYNWQTGVMTVRHLPQIEDNIIAFNRASGIQGWDVRTTTSSVNHNTIAYNANHGIAIGGASDVVIENNIIAFNERFGLKLSSDSEKSKIVRNNFYNNLPQFDAMPGGNYNFNPAFIAPKRGLNFTLDPRLCCQIKASDNENLGARIF